MEIIKFDSFKINESFSIPNIRLEEFLHNISHADKVHKMSVAAYYTTYEAYVDLVEPKTHMFKVNDLKGDIMGNNRVGINVITFSDNELESIKMNIVNFCLNQFFTDIPNTVDIFGIQVKPLTYINKEQIKQLFENNINIETTIRIIAETSKFNYEGVKNKYHVWSQK